MTRKGRAHWRDYAIARHYPEAAQSKARFRALLDGVIGRQARLIAQWMMMVSSMV